MEGGRPEGEVVGIGYPDAGELEFKETFRGEYVDRKQIMTGGRDRQKRNPI